MRRKDCRKHRLFKKKSREYLEIKFKGRSKGSSRIIIKYMIRCRRVKKNNLLAFRNNGRLT